MASLRDQPPAGALLSGPVPTGRLSKVPSDTERPPPFREAQRRAVWFRGAPGLDVCSPSLSRCDSGSLLCSFRSAGIPASYPQCDASVFNPPLESGKEFADGSGTGNGGVTPHQGRRTPAGDFRGTTRPAAGNRRVCRRQEIWIHNPTGFPDGFYGRRFDAGPAPSKSEDLESCASSAAISSQDSARQKWSVPAV